MKTTTRSPGALALTLATLAVALLGSPGCRAIEGIFKAGVVGLVVVLAIVFVLARLVGSR
jgi:H+/gluconate symporter-like permease